MICNSLTDVEMDMLSSSGGKNAVLQTATAVAISFVICKAVNYLTKLWNIQGGCLPGVTALVVILATIFPAQSGYLAPASDTVALVLMQVNEISPIHPK